MEWMKWSSTWCYLTTSHPQLPPTFSLHSHHRRSFFSSCLIPFHPYFSEFILNLINSRLFEGVSVKNAQNRPYFLAVFYVSSFRSTDEIGPELHGIHLVSDLHPNFGHPQDRRSIALTDGSSTTGLMSTPLVSNPSPDLKSHRSSFSGSL